jgi:hypothetical protein
MQISFNNGNDKKYQHMLNNLLKDIFFDFQFWYDLNLWDKNSATHLIALYQESPKICTYTPLPSICS